MIYQVQATGVYPSQFYNKQEALDYARTKADQTGKKFRVYALSGGNKKALNPTIPYAVVDTQTGSVVQKFSVRKDAQEEARYRNKRSPGRYKAVVIGVRGIDYDKRRNPKTGNVSLRALLKRMTPEQQGDLIRSIDRFYYAAIGEGFKPGEAQRFAEKRAIPEARKIVGRNPTGALLFRTRAAALKYAREHGAKRFSIKKLKRGR